MNFIDMFLAGIDREQASEVLIHLKYQFPEFEKAGLKEWADLEHLPRHVQYKVFEALRYLSIKEHLKYCPSCPSCQADKKALQNE